MAFCQVIISEFSFYWLLRISLNIYSVCCIKKASNNNILELNPMQFICQTNVFRKSALFRVHLVLSFVSCDLLTVSLGFSFWLASSRRKTVVLLNTSYIYSVLFCYLSVSPCLSLWLSEKVFPRMTHLLLIWRTMAAGHGRYVLEKKLHSLSALTWCTISWPFFFALPCVRLFLFVSILHDVVHFSCVVLFAYCRCLFSIHYRNPLLHAHLWTVRYLVMYVPGLENAWKLFSKSCF